MENASKALIMAGSVLIAIMIIGALLLMFNSLSSYQNTEIQNEREAQTLAFNNQFSTYNRDNVRGSELYSLLNKVVDYNRRKSTEGTGTSDEGQYLAYEPMKVTFKIETNKLEKFYAPEVEDMKQKKHLIPSSCMVDSITNDFDKVYNAIKKLEADYGAETLNNLVTAFTSIYYEDDDANAISKFNNACKNQNKLVSSRTDINKHFEKICQYYEYVQFKRAKFNCTSAKYSEKTGRIIEMNFEFTGNFQ